jgi:hypothetical protein
MSLIKYIGEQSDGDHGRNLNWPGLHGLPVRGEVGLLKDDELDEFFELAYDFHCKEFHLSNPEELKEYTQVKDRIVNGWYVEKFVDNYRDSETGLRVVYLEWCQSYGQINPKSQLRAAEPGGSTIKRVG